MSGARVPVHAGAAPLQVEDLFKVGAGLPQADLDALRAYLEPFAKAPRDSEGHECCVGCGKPVDGLRAALGLAVAYQWSLAHGEARCTGCGWPARGMHYIKRADGTELATLRNLFLPYRPSVVEVGDGA